MYISIATALATVINIVLNYLLIPYGGYVIAAYTTVIGYFAALVFHYCVCFNSKYKSLFDEKYFLKNILFCASSMIGALYVYNYFLVRYMIILLIIFASIIMLRNWKEKQL